MNRIYINDNWRFTENYSDSLLQDDFDMSQLEEVRLPHTTREVPFHYFDESAYQMLCGYRRIISCPEEWKGKRIFVTFEAAGHSAQVYLNGEYICEHHNGYTAFTAELTDYLRYGKENFLTVKVDSRENQNIPPFGFVIDYMTFGGLYREAYLEVKENDCFKDVFVRSEIDFSTHTSEGLYKAALKIDIELDKKNNINCADYIRTSLINGDDSVILGDEAIGIEKISMEKAVGEIELWSLENPKLYTLKCELIQDLKVVDVFETRVGFRKAEFKSDGFFLNEKKVKLRGLNRHQSYPYVGYAMPESMQKYDADLLKKELGLNAVRTSHYPQSHHFVDRCDEIGLLVFMEIPGWQHIGDDDWKRQAINNTREMVTQYRNHTSIILWGVRINESADDDDFYMKTNAIARELDDSRATGGVRAHKKSSLLEDVYTYNDFSHNGSTPGCLPKKNVTSNMKKSYLISEYNGHMYPTKSFDWEEHRVEHALRHANVLDQVAVEKDIAGSFGWCMFDYNTHKDFGSGDRICYHGVMDMFRNPKLAALIYACESDKENILELSSSMDIGEHPGCNRGFTYIISNADSVRMFKNDIFIKEYTKADSPYKNLKHGPMIIDDFIGNQIHKNENFKKDQADIIKKGLNYTATHGYSRYPIGITLGMAKCMLLYRMKPTDAVKLYNKYVGDWGGTSTVYRFEAVKNGKVVKTITKEPMKKLHIELDSSSCLLHENTSYDVAEIRIKVVDDNGNLMSFYGDPVGIKISGPVEAIGPVIVPVRGGMAGTYIKTTGNLGDARVTIGNPQVGSSTIDLRIE